MSAWRRDYGGGRFGRPAMPPPIARPALFARLDGGRWLTTVVAGTGAGKSTLLDAWATARGAVLRELSVRDSDRPIPELDEPEDRIVVLDGLHELRSGGPALQSIAERSRQVGDGLWLVLASREQVPFPLGEHLAIGEADLRFAEDETYQVLGAALGDAEGADVLAPDLHLLTGGWPGLVGLAAAWLARQPRADRPKRLRQLARLAGPLSEQLTQALLEALPPGEREAVQRLACLPPIDAAVADALDLTENLGALAPLVQPVPGRSGWYAVPAALRAAVREQLPLDEAERRALLRAAADAFLARGNHDAAAASEEEGR